MTKLVTDYYSDDKNDENVCADGPCAHVKPLPVSGLSGVVALFYCDAPDSTHFGHAIKAQKHPTCNRYWVKP